MTDFVPERAEELARIVASAAADREPLEILGNGTKRTMGRPVGAQHTLSTSRLRGVTLYEPEELVLTARAGTPLSEIETLLAEHNQQLAFEPPHWGEQTIGGVIAAGLSGPRRIQAGAVRDHLLGFSAVNGRGELFKAGGRVVKNVTGYDLSKLMAGSFGTLAVMSDVTLKVLPRPEARATLVLKGKTANEATILFRKALGMPFDITGAAWVPSFNSESVAALRLEGFADSVADRAASLQQKFGGAIAGSEFDDSWAQVRDVTLLQSAPCLWRVSVPPSLGAELLNEMESPNSFLDWGGGLVWLGTPDENPQAETPRMFAAKSGGHATLVRANVKTRETLAVFQPQPAALAALTKRVKDSFDPLGILNPGRMYAGI